MTVCNNPLSQIFVCLLLYTTNSLAYGQSSEHRPTVEEASVKYASLAEDWKAKRSLCLELIDQELIERGLPMKDVLTIFKKDAVIITGAPTAECLVTVLFEKQMEPSADESLATSFLGWYMHIKSDATGRVIRYDLSNIHK